VNVEGQINADLVLAAALLNIDRIQAALVDFHIGLLSGEIAAELKD
jgi:hypothetical protein